MHYSHYTQVIGRRARFVILFSILGLFAASVAVFAQPLRYGATVRLLIIQRSSLGLDPYTAVKSAERIADNLSQVVYTQDFFSKTLAHDSSINQTQFPTDPTKRRKAWQRTVRTELTPGTGLLAITTLSTDKKEAIKIAESIAGVLTISGREYVGGDLDVKLVDSPIPSAYPISPNIPLSLALGLAVGFVIGILYALWTGEAEHGHL